jgi:ankyrin repeat protein
MIISENLKQWLEKNDYNLNDLNHVGQYGNSALMKVSREAKCNLVDELLQLGVELETKNIDGNTALWNGCFGGSYTCVKLLIEAGIDLDTKNDNGVTALMYCASSGREDMTKVLLEYGAKKDIENLDGFKAIDLATTPKIVKMLRR